ncbi:phage tail tube protein [Pseudacidovorax intermedius]|uniref:phage tail tube protein n=1 Tax=Pseudacidovorax intermedius TaxID=433924 RepID=UPI0026E951B7|nr:phage tail tube protein [Pseudacidovorax intermedius]
MAFEPQIWSNVAVDCQTELGAAKAITAISNASPPVASSAGHTFEVGDFVLLRLNGAKGYDMAVARIGAVVANTSFTLPGIDPADVAGAAGTAEKITFDAAADVITDVSASGGEAADVPINTIHTRRAYNKPGVESALVYSFTALWKPDDPLLVEFARAQRAGDTRAVRMTFEDGSVAVFSGYPTASRVPTGSAGNPVTTPAKVNARGYLTVYEGV